MPRPRGLTKKQVGVIEHAVDHLFDQAKARFLGPGSIDKRIVAAFREDLSLPGLFLAASREERNRPDESLLHSIMRIANGYIEATRQETKAKVVKHVDAFLKDARAKGIKTDMQTVLGGELPEVWGKVTANMRRIIDTESTGARNMGTLDAIVKINAASGIEDPTVYFVVVRDEHLCDECKRLHLLDDGKTPRVWKMSELGHGYHKRGQDSPKLGGLHPHCRCSLVTLMPGYGFDAAGFVTFKHLDWDEIKQQRG